MKLNQRGTSIIEMMVAMVVLGIVISGTYEGIAAIGATTSVSEKSLSAQHAVAEAALVLENLPVDSPLLKDDGDSTDLADAVTPDQQKNPATGASTWTIKVNGKSIGLLYNISKGTIGANITSVNVIAVWDDTGNAPFAGPRDHLHRVERLILRGGTP